MTGVKPWLRGGPATYEVAENIIMDGINACLVEGRTGSKVGIAAASSLSVMGAAVTDAVAAANQNTATYGTTVTGAQLTDVGVPPVYTTVEHRVELRMKYSGTATFGQVLRAGAPSGGISTVTPWVSGTDSPATIVGRCTEPAGVASGGSGLVLLSV